MITIKKIRSLKPRVQLRKAADVFHEANAGDADEEYLREVLGIILSSDLVSESEGERLRGFFAKGPGVGYEDIYYNVLAVLGDSLYILTWMNKVAFIYDFTTLEYVSTLSYPRQGWGLTADGKSLIASDGSSRLYFLDRNLRVTGTVNVRLHGKPLNYLNELEYIDGKVWANVYMTNMIVIIDPASGKVEAVIDCAGLLPQKMKKPQTDVLNGIAYDSRTGKIYVTGKNWPLMFEIALEEKKV